MFRLLIVLVAASAPAATLQALQNVQVFDDEGTFLAWFLSLRAGHVFYDEIFSLYGPSFHLFYGLLYGPLGIPISHTAGRLIAASFWIATCAGFAAFSFQVSRSYLAAAATYVAVFLWLPALMHSPGHPEELGLLLTSCVMLTAGRMRSGSVGSAWAIGAALAGIALLKINFGVFVGGAVGAVLIARLPAGGIKNGLAFAISGSLLALPIVLGSFLWHLNWVPLFVVFAECTLGAALIVLWSQRVGPALRLLDLGRIALGGAVTAAAIIGLAIVWGSSPKAIFAAILLQNARSVSGWYVPVAITPLFVVLSGFSLVLAVCAAVSTHHPRYRAALPWVQAVFLGAALLIGSDPPTFYVALVPFAWIIILPPPGCNAAIAAARALAGVLAATMCLYPYPAAGHQILLGAVVVIAMLPNLLQDCTSAVWAGRFGPSLPRPLPVKLGLALALGMTLTIVTVTTVQNYWRAVPLGMPGTAFVRVSDEQAAEIAWVVAQLGNCTVSFSLPAQPSLTIWAGQRLLTPVNINATLNFIDDDRQRALVDALSRERSLCVLTHPALERFLDRGQIARDPPLLHYVRTSFAIVAERHGYVIRTRNGD